MSKFGIRIIATQFVRLILPVFFFEAVSSTKNVGHEWKKSTMNHNNEKIGYENDV